MKKIIKIIILRILSYILYISLIVFYNWNFGENNCMIVYSKFLKENKTEIWYIYNFKKDKWWYELHVESPYTNQYKNYVKFENEKYLIWVVKKCDFENVDLPYILKRTQEDYCNLTRIYSNFLSNNKNSIWE